MKLPVPRLALLLCLALYLPGAFAHDSRPVFIRVDADASGQVLLAWKIPDSVAPAAAPAITLSANCTPAVTSQPADETGVVRSLVSPSALQGLRWYTCIQPALPTAVSLAWPADVPSLSTLVRLQLADASTRTLHASPGETGIPLPVATGTGEVFLQYLALGVEHILGGYDHLLFVACLVLLAGTLRRIALAVTGFTLAHSVTLISAALGIVRLPVPPVETCIALSIVFLAAELARNRRDTLTWRYPLLVAATFGLLHGFGFAAVLGEIGLPHGEALAALLSFNLGVEVGQLGFVLLVAPALRLVAHAVRSRADTGAVARYAAYPIGVLATFWTLDRLATFVA